VFPSYYKGLPAGAYWLMGAAGAVGLFFSIVFHELCHSVVAKRFGIPMRGITLFIFGGVAEMEDEPTSPKAEFMMAIAGPVSSVVLGLGFLVLAMAGRFWAWSSMAVGVFSYLGFINLLLAGFNLLPAFPLDGGRVLRALLWGWKRNLRWSTDIASKVGSAFGVGLIVLGVVELLLGNFLGGFWWALIGLFLRGAAHTSYQQVRVREMLEGEKVRKFMNTEPVTVSPWLTVEDLVEKYVYTTHHKLYPVVDGGSLVGCVTLDQVKHIPHVERERRRVGDLARECSAAESAVDPDEDALKALARMRRNGTSRLMVVKNDALVGIVTLKDLMRFLSLKIDLED
jgi:Zn-dependent protease/predicted transcriptional regulator